MRLSRRAALNGVQLDEIHEAIVIRGADPGAARENITAVNRMDGMSQRMTSRVWNPLEASVRYAINIPKRRLAERRAVFDAVNAWANRTGWLEFNWMPGKRMYADAAVLPSGGDMWDRNEEFTITFRAYSVPFWQDAEATEVTASEGASGTLMINVKGTARSVLDASFRNTSGGTVQDFTIHAGRNTISLSGIGLADGGTLSISHGTDGLMRITKGNTSVYNKYTGADDLYVDPGSVSVSYMAEGSGILTIRNYGRYI